MIAIITYDAPHRKTQDVIYGLLFEGYSDIQLVIIPWQERKSFKPLFKHRPSRAKKIYPEVLAQRLNLKSKKVDIEDLDQFFQKNEFEHIVLAGAGLLPDSLAKNHKIINGHPGYLPMMRGLDALKWAILKGERIGVSTHFISEKADEGILIERETVPIYFNDTFDSLALRVYDKEIEMIVRSIGVIRSDACDLTDLSIGGGEANRRMPHSLELKMIKEFELRMLKAESGNAGI